MINSLSMLSLLIEGHSNDRLDEMDIKQEYDLNLAHLEYVWMPAIHFLSRNGPRNAEGPESRVPTCRDGHMVRDSRVTAHISVQRLVPCNKHHLSKERRSCVLV